MIACKMHEVTPPEVTDFSYISAGTYKRHQIIEMEIDICTLLAFNLQIVTPHHFTNINLRASHVSGNGIGRPVCSIQYEDTMTYMVEYLLEIAALTFDFVPENPSKLAAAAIYLARATLGIRDATDPNDESHQGYFSRTLKHYSGYDTQELKEIVMKLHGKHVGASVATLHSVFDKYQKSDFKMVALSVPVEKELLENSFNRFRGDNE